MSDAAATTDYPSFSLDGRVALVTGASRGIGRALALALAAAGADVVARRPRRGRSATSSPSRSPRPAAAHTSQLLDVTGPTRSRAPSRDGRRRFGRIDILVNNAGLGPENPAEDVTEADFDLTLRRQPEGHLLRLQAVGRQMIAQGYGRIVNLGSQAGFVALPGESVYCMTKAAISHLTKCLAVEWGPHGITVNAVAPTFIVTPGTARRSTTRRSKADILERIAALHRDRRPMDVAGAVVFLASPAASLITGHTILIDGGWTAR